MVVHRLAGPAGVLAGLASAVALAACGGGGQGSGAAGHSPESSPVSGSVQEAVLPTGATAPATAMETQPARARALAQRAVGSCLARAWHKAGLGQSYGTYAGHGMVQFATGTRSRPTGNLAQDTLVTVRVYANGKVAGIPDSSQGAEGRLTVDDRALSHWGCAR